MGRAALIALGVAFLAGVMAPREWLDAAFLAIPGVRPEDLQAHLLEDPTLPIVLQKLGGHGLAFRMPLRWWLYLQVAGGVWHTEDKKQHDVGFNLNYLLRQDQRLRLFINAGVGYFYRRELVGTSGGQDVFDTDKNWNLGGGVGLEYLQGSRWAWKVEADFAHLGKSGDIKVIPQAGISYYW